MGLVWKQRIGRVWYLSYAEELGRKRRSLHTENKNLAERIRWEEEKDFHERKHGLKPELVQKIRFSEFAALFINRKKLDGKAESTIDGYTSTLNAFGFFLNKRYEQKGDRYVNEITAGDIERFADYRRTGLPPAERPINVTELRPMNLMEKRQRAPKSVKTIRNDLINLKVVFAWAAKKRYLLENPCEDIELPRRVKQAPLYLRPSEYLKLMESIDAYVLEMKGKKDKQSRRRAADAMTFKIVLQFYLLTGCREDEGCSIRPSTDLDLETPRPVLRVPMSKVGDYKTIPIESELLPIIQELLKRCDGRDVLIPMHPDSLYHAFKNHAKRAGLSGKLTFHSLRHTAGTWLAAQGVGLRHLQDFLGHSDAQSTQIYIHSVNDELRQQLAKLRLPIQAAKP
jgi:integrase